MTQVTLPNLSRTKADANLFSDAVENDEALKKVVNSELDNENLKAGAGIVGSKLAEETIEAKKLAASAKELFPQNAVAGTYKIARGVTAELAENATVEVTHGLGAEPASIQVSPLGGAGLFRIDSKGATKFTIHNDSGGEKSKAMWFATT